MGRSVLLAAAVATSALTAGLAEAAFRLTYSAHDLNGTWRFDAVEVASMQGRRRGAGSDVTAQLECRLALRHVNERRARATSETCFDNLAGWQASDVFTSDDVDFIVKSDGDVEIYLADKGSLRGRLTRDRRVVKGQGRLTLDEPTRVVWTMARQ